MRKLLLATVAALGASMGVATVADAQSFPTPGTVTIRLNGRFRFYGGVVSDRGANNNFAGSPNSAGNATSPSASTALVNGANQGPLTGTNKQNSYGFVDYARLYPGFDGVAANGLKYGASLEIRQDQYSGAGGGVFGSASQQNRARAGLYFRREWGYIGTDQLGTIRLGSTDQPSSLYMTGNFENFNDGGLDGDVGGLASQNLILPWPFADGQGSYYTTTKAIYLSPQLYGFDFGVSYEPGTGNTGGVDACNGSSPVGNNFVTTAGAFAASGANGAGVSGPGCDRLSSSPINAESARRTNTVDALLRYRGTFGNFGIAATGAYVVGGHVLDNSGVAFTNNPLAATGARPNYDGVNVGDFGIALTYGGFSFGGKYQFGRFNGGMGALVPKGLPGGEAILGGFSYTTGPIVVGAHYLNLKTAGDAANAYFGRKRYEQGVAAGGTYSLAPGLSLFASYLYSERKQSGNNFLTGQGVTATQPGGNPFNNKVSAQVFAVGTGFSW